MLYGHIDTNTDTETEIDTDISIIFRKACNFMAA